jgi:rare lipoprotein A
MDKTISKFAKISLLLCLTTAFSIMTACSTIHKKDGPPGFMVDETKIPDAIPKAERLSKFGNMPFYNVFGKRYYVMASCKNYEERGTASWYGTMFHARRTSSGEPYDMLAMTAAHKTLPLPTYVQVTNLKNGRKVVVKVNDRGPFEANRIIDLSYVAAKKLGMLGRGTAYVDVKVIDPLAAYHQTKSSVCTTGQVHTFKTATGLFLQAGSFKSKHLAVNLQKKLQKRLSIPVEIEAANGVYRVQVGPVGDKAGAFRVNKQLRALGIQTTHKHKQLHH